MSIDIMRNSS